VLGATGDLVAELEPHHQLQQLVPQGGGVALGPDGVELGAGKATTVGPHRWGIEGFVDGVGAPLGLEDDGVLEDGVVVEVEDDPQVVEVAAEGGDAGWVGELVGAAEVVIFAQGEGVAAIGIVFEGGADPHPELGQGDAHVGQAGDALLDGGGNVR
jgi:hypothetical protein